MNFNPDTFHSESLSMNAVDESVIAPLRCRMKELVRISLFGLGGGIQFKAAPSTLFRGQFCNGVDESKKPMSVIFLTPSITEAKKYARNPPRTIKKLSVPPQTDWRFVDLCDDRTQESLRSLFAESGLSLAAWFGMFLARKTASQRGIERDFFDLCWPVLFQFGIRGFYRKTQSSSIQDNEAEEYDLYRHWLDEVDYATIDPAIVNGLQ